MGKGGWIIVALWMDECVGALGGGTKMFLVPEEAVNGGWWGVDEQMYCKVHFYSVSDIGSSLFANWKVITTTLFCFFPSNLII